MVAIMYKRVLLALDLEGVNRVVGEPYKGLFKQTQQWEIAKEQAVLELNAAATALFEAGVEKVGVWDNHDGGSNIDATKLDSRIKLISQGFGSVRMDFIHGEYDCICYFGYHAMEGTLGGVLAHTMSSTSIQYYKLNGKHIGEVDMDAYIAASHGVPSRFFAGGNIACAQATRAVSDIVTVVTKEELARNKAIFRDNEALFADIKERIVEAVRTEGTINTLKFPAVMEKSYKRMEDAAEYILSMQSQGICAEYLDDPILGKDAHTVVVTVNTMDEFIKSI